jgi:hypothetical protein
MPSLMSGTLRGVIYFWQLRIRATFKAAFPCYCAGDGTLHNFIEKEQQQSLPPIKFQRLGNFGGAACVDFILVRPIHLGSSNFRM